MLNTSHWQSSRNTPISKGEVHANKYCWCFGGSTTLKSRALQHPGCQLTSELQLQMLRVTDMTLKSITRSQLCCEKNQKQKKDLHRWLWKTEGAEAEKNSVNLILGSCMGGVETTYHIPLCSRGIAVTVFAKPVHMVPLRIFNYAEMLVIPVLNRSLILWVKL